MKPFSLMMGLFLALAFFCISPAVAAEAPYEATMVVTGTIVVNPDGSVRTYTLDNEAQIPPDLVGLIKATVTDWKFEPVLDAGKPVVAETGMSLRLIAHQTDSNHATAAVAGASFGCAVGPRSDLANCGPFAVTYAYATQPKYPYNALMSQMSAVAYVLLQIGPDGHVAKAAVRQVNLRERMRAQDADTLRGDFGDAALAAARRFVFHLSDAARQAASRGTMIVTVPFNFSMRDDRVAYGHWMAYMPGPVKTIPWSGQQRQGLAVEHGTDAVPASEPFANDARFVLLTPPGGSADNNSQAARAGQG